jgi:hypothetical protein
MSQVFCKMPSLVGEHYVHSSPVWVATLLRLLFGVCAITTATMFYIDWDNTSLGFRVLACLLVPAFTFFSLHKKAWQSISFIAADNGIFFPCNELVVITLGRKRKTAWLLVPWTNIANVRLAKYLDNDNDLRTCVALDLKVSQKERADFFQYVANPTDGAHPSENILSVAYGGALPSPKKTFTRLKELELRHNPAFQRTRRDETASPP